MPRLEPAVLEGNAAISPLVERIVKGRGQVGELYSILLKSPLLSEGLLNFGTAIRQQATLSGRVRELVICQVGMLNGAEYEVFRHRAIAIDEGLSSAAIDRLPAWHDSPLFTDGERAALALADAMTNDIRVPDETFEALRDFFNELEILELTMTIAYYNMISRFLVALEIEPTPESSTAHA